MSELIVVQSVVSASPTVADTAALYREAERLWRWLWHEKVISWSLMTFNLLDLDKRYLNPVATQRDAEAVCRASIAEAKTHRESYLRNKEQSA